MSDCAPCEAARLEAGLGDAARLLEKHFNASAAVDYVLALATTIARRDKVPCSQISDSLEQMIALLRRAAPSYRPGINGKKYEQAVRAYNHLREVALKSC